MQRILRLEGHVQSYAWGSRTLIAELLGRPVAGEAPEAELWLGVHERGEARVVLPDGGRVALGAWIARDPRAVLGDAVVARFGARLPYLFKLLAVEQALSLQAHPDAAQARAGFERERAAGVAAAERLYADPEPKPELVVAHTRFRALCGFRPLDAIRVSLRAAGLSVLAPPDGVAESAWLRGFFARWFGEDDAAERGGLLARLAAAAQRAASADSALACVAQLAELHPGDPGVLAPLLLHTVDLEPGEALFLEPGELHCYLAGAAAEIMTSSDNVLRAGLTTKRRAPGELAAIGRFASRAPRVLRGGAGAAGVFAYPTPASEFELARIEVQAEPVALPGGNVEIVLCHAGRARLCPAAGGAAVVLARGEAALVRASVGPWRFAGPARLYRAGVPDTARTTTAPLPPLR